MCLFKSDVCFLRLDFETFTTQGIGGTAVVDEGVCLDTFTVTVFICGKKILWGTLYCSNLNFPDPDRPDHPHHLRAEQRIPQ